MLNMLFLAVSLLIYSTHCATAFFNHFLLGVQFLFWCDAIHFVEYFVGFGCCAFDLCTQELHSRFECMKTAFFMMRGRK